VVSRAAPSRPSLERVRALVGAVPDPELPMVTIAELGILRAVEHGPGGEVVVTITPTYSGCPAMDAIRQDIGRVLREHGVAPARVRTVLAPAWSTDWLTEAARRKLAEHGIAPPGPRGPASGGVFVPLAVRCPNCGAADTREQSHFGSTACKALWVCAACGEPFEHFKAL
jgi:ring-1,2-phenylacetyl-CoA epoxidase subunit PaaD